MAVLRWRRKSRRISATADSELIEVAMAQASGGLPVEALPRAQRRPERTLASPEALVLAARSVA